VDISRRCGLAAFTGDPISSRVGPRHRLPRDFERATGRPGQGPVAPSGLSQVRAEIATMAATNKCLAQMNKSRTAAKATKEQDRS
jgi:hypothetical protein